MSKFTGIFRFTYSFVTHNAGTSETMREGKKGKRREGSKEAVSRRGVKAEQLPPAPRLVLLDASVAISIASRFIRQ